jgi:hypothetical protein
MPTIKQRVRAYLEAQRPYYGDEEVQISLQILEIQNEDLSSMESFHKMLILRLIDITELYADIEAAFIKKD